MAERKAVGLDDEDGGSGPHSFSSALATYAADKVNCAGAGYRTDLVRISTADDPTR